MEASQAAEVTPRQFTNKQFAQLMFGAGVGSLFEWYDFYLAAVAAAAVWPKIYFPQNVDPALAVAVSVSTVGIAYIAKLVGALIFGHFGDKYGRRTTLVWTLLLMGTASLGIAVLPPYSSIGVLALVILFILRFVIGVGFGGEPGGAWSWIIEARPGAKHRAFWTSWPTALLGLGRIFSILAFYAVASSLSNAAYLDWGWRVPFALGGVMLVIALIVRVKIMESPMFQQLATKRTVLKYPAFQVMREQGRKIFTMLWMDVYTVCISVIVILPYSVSYLVKLGVEESFATLSVSAGGAVAIFTILGAAFISDYVGRLKVMRLFAVLTIVLLYPYFFLLNTLNPVWIIVAQSVFYGILPAPTGAMRTLFTESFATKYRYSGAGLTYQFGSLVAGVIVALIFPVVLLAYGVLGAWQPLVWISIALTVVSIAASFFVKETRGIAVE